MREYKFRVWDTENKEMLKVQELDFEDTFYGGRLSIRTDQYNDYFDIEDMILMQYTGLKDKKQKEIYEGDIIDFSYDMFVGNFDTFVAKGKVVFEEGAFYIEVFENERTTKDEVYLLYSINLDTIEVIGNVWEDSDLLNDNKNTKNN